MTVPAPDLRAALAPRRVLAAVLVALVCGGFVAAQSRLNGGLSVAGAGVLVASLLSYVGTLATSVLVIVLMGRARATATLLRRDSRWWWYAIGLFGIPIVLTMAAGVPILGVAIASVCSVAGQTLSGLALDARGVGVPEALRLNGRRVVAGLTAVAGLVIAVLAGSGGLTADLATVVGLGLLVFVGGFTLAGQQAGNGKVTALSGDPVVAGITSSAGGTLGVALIVAVAAATGNLEVTLPAFAEHWHLYLGGPLGAGITIGAAWAVRHLGTFALTLAIVGGQMVTAVVIDLLGGIGVHGATLLAATMIGLATLLAVGRRRTDIVKP